MNTAEHIESIRKLEDDLENIAVQIIDEASQAFPVGSIITFNRGRHLVGGKIIGIETCSWTDLPRFKIESHTGNIYRVSFHLLAREFSRHGNIMFDDRV